MGRETKPESMVTEANVVTCDKQYIYRANRKLMQFII